MGRLIVLFIPLLVLCFGGGFLVGRAGKKRAIEQAGSNVRSVLAAARNMTDLDWLGRPADANLKVQSLQLALDEYDANQRKALL